MSPERIGHVEGGSFVDERAGTAQGEGKGFADPEAMMRQRDVVDEQLDSLEHVLAAIDPAELEWSQVERLTTINERLLEVYKAGLIALLKGQQR